MGEPTAETITPPTQATTQAPETNRPSLLNKLKSLLSTIGNGAKSVESVNPYHLPEPPPQPKKNPPPNAFPTGS